MENRMPLLEDVKSVMTCSHCGSRVVTHERLARESGLSLRSVVRFLQGAPISNKTKARIEAWLDAAAIERVVKS
jgi:DNA-directed RNA polymerase subunit RPC12/RpoP